MKRRNFLLTSLGTIASMGLPAATNPCISYQDAMADINGTRPSQLGETLRKLREDRSVPCSEPAANDVLELRARQEYDALLWATDWDGRPRDRNEAETWAYNFAEKIALPFIQQYHHPLLHQGRTLAQAGFNLEMIDQPNFGDALLAMYEDIGVRIEAPIDDSAARKKLETVRNLSPALVRKFYNPTTARGVLSYGTKDRPQATQSHGELAFGVLETLYEHLILRQYGLVDGVKELTKDACGKFLFRTDDWEDPRSQEDLSVLRNGLRGDAYRLSSRFATTHRIENDYWTERDRASILAAQAMDSENVLFHPIPTLANLGEATFKRYGTRRDEVADRERFYACPSPLLCQISSSTPPAQKSQPLIGP